MISRRNVFDRRKGFLIIAAFVVAAFATPRHSEAVIVVTGTDIVLNQSSSLRTLSLELFIQFDSAPPEPTVEPFDLNNYQIRVILSGPAAGTDVYLTGGGATDTGGSHPPIDTNLTVNNPSLTEVSASTFNFGTYSVSDNAGVLRLDYEIAADAVGLYTFDIVEGTSADTLFLDDMDQPFDITIDSPTLLIIPEPAGGILLTVSAVALLARRRRL